VVEHSIGNGEVDSSILSGSTTASAQTKSGFRASLAPKALRLAGGKSVARNTRGNVKIKASFRFD
jgi:hypothetical protein